MVEKVRDDTKIKRDDTVVIQWNGIKIEATVLTANHWGKQDGWYIEMVDKNGVYRYWKQNQDGGELIEHIKSV